MLPVVEVLEVEADALQRFGRRIGDAETEQRVTQQATHQEFQRQVADPANVFALDRHACLAPALHQPIARGEHDGLVQEGRLRAYRAPSEHAAEVVREVLEDGIRRHWQGRCLQQFDVADADGFIRAC